MAGLVFLTDVFGWTPQEAIEASIVRSDVQYALNLEPGAAVSTRTVECSQKLFRENDLAARVFLVSARFCGGKGRLFARSSALEQEADPGREQG